MSSEELSFEELLIGEVQQYDCLHNPSSPSYNNALLTERAWQSISVRLDIPGDLCRKRWRTLRKNYKQRKKRLQLLSGHAVEDAKIRWKYFQQLSFLDTDDNNDTKVEPESAHDVVELPEAASSGASSPPSTPPTKAVEIPSNVQDEYSSLLDETLLSTEELPCANLQYMTERSSSSSVKFMTTLGKRIYQSAPSQQEMAQLELETTIFVLSKIADIKKRFRCGNGVMGRTFH